MSSPTRRNSPMSDAQFAQAVAEHGSRLFDIAYRIVHDRHLAEDAVAETYLKAWQQRTTLAEPQKILAWLASICRREAINCLRFQKRLRTCPEPEQYHKPAANQPEWDEAQYSAQLLGKLPDELKVCASLFFEEGRTHTEIATISGLPLSTVRGYIYRSRRMLRKELQMSSERGNPGKPDCGGELRAQGDTVEWCGARVRFLGSCWAGQKALYDRTGKRLSRLPAGISDHPAFGRRPDHPEMQLSLFWKMSAEPHLSIGTNAFGIPSGADCQPCMAVSETIRGAIITGFMCGPPPETDQHIRPRSMLWGQEIRDSERAFRVTWGGHGNLSTSKPGWGSLVVFSPKKGPRPGTSVVSLAFSSPVAEEGCVVFGLSKAGAEITTLSREGLGSHCQEGHLRGEVCHFGIAPEMLTGLVIYPRSRTRIDWGRVKLPPRPGSGPHTAVNEP